MEGPARAADATARQVRAERILDVAGELLLRLGYRRVTIEDVADRAGIGKGTVYLHWRTREALFFAVIEREYLGAIDELLAALRADPETALLHRLTSCFFLGLMRRPLVRAALVGDLELLGKLAAVRDEGPMRERADGALRALLLQLQEHGLLRADMATDELAFAYQATLMGYYLQLDDDRHSVSMERQAELLADTVRRTFEPEAPPREAATAVAPRVIEIYSDIAAIIRADLARAYA
jgi:AcrR family transcriptional regulator